MIKTFNTHEEFTQWLNGTLLKSSIIAYVVENKMYYFSTNNVSGEFATYNGTFQDVMNGNYPQAIKDEIYVHDANINPQPPKEKYVPTERYNADAEALNAKIDDADSILQTQITDNKEHIEEHLADAEYVWYFLYEKVNELALYKFPNVTIIGEPRVNNGQISNFSETNFIQFPFLVDFHNQTFEINMCFTTSDDVTTQQNILDSHFGLAFAVRNSKLVLAMSSNGTEFDMGEHIGTHDITPNTTYYIKYSWDGSVYKVKVSDNIEGNYITDITVTDSKSLYPTQIIIGKCNDNTFVFKGIINLNYCTLKIRDKEVWQGMDSVGVATRLQTDMGNIDSLGITRLKNIIGENFLSLEVTFDDETTETYNVIKK